MARKLTEVEVFYIQNNKNLTAEQLAKTIKGVGVAQIQSTIDNSEKTDTSSTTVAKTGEHDPEKHNVYNTFAKDKGAIVMTQAASELADARKILQVNQPKGKDQSDKIYVIHSNRPTR